MFGKVFTQIFDSSIADDLELRHFFMDLIVLSDPNGVVDMTPASIAARTRIPLDRVLSCLAKLEQPDPESRTADHDGRRIARLDAHRSWGWVIINHARFRNTASEAQRREKTRIRVAKFKSKHQQKGTGNAPLTHGNAPLTHGNAPLTHGNAPLTHGNAGNGMQKQKQKQKHRGPPNPQTSETSFQEVPSFEQALAQTQAVGIPEDFCRHVFDDWSSRDGKDAGGVAVRWLPYVTKRWSRERGDWTKGTHKGKPGAKVIASNPRLQGQFDDAEEKRKRVEKIIAAQQKAANEKYEKP